MNVTKSISNLIGGISQQPAPLRLANQCEEQLNFVASPANGLQTRPPLRFKSSTTFDKDAAFFCLDRDADSKWNLWVYNQGIRIETLDGTVITPTYEGTAKEYLTLPSGTDPHDAFKILPVADSCFVLNRTKTVLVDPDSYTARQNQALIHIPQVTYGTTWTVVLDDVTVSFGYDSSSSQTVSTSEVAESLTNKLLADSTIAASFTIVTASSVIYIVRKDGGEFSIGVADTRGNTYSTLTTYKIQDFTDLPTIAPDGFTCCITGDNGSTADDFYVKFVGSSAAASSSVLMHGQWEECVAPECLTTLDASTLPHLLVHDVSTDTWTIRPATWEDRKVGDDESAPLPSFVEKTLTNIFMFRNRLGFLAGDSVCMSAAGNFERFFPETVQTLADADPIDISVAVDDFSSLLGTCVVQDNLFFWSERRQYVLTTPDTFSPKTASILPSTAYPCMPDAGVPVAGSRCFYVDSDTNYIQVYEYTVDSYTYTKDASSITAHVPNLLPVGKARVSIDVSQTVGALVFFTDTARDMLWLYQYYISGGQKLQSAWSKISLPGEVRNCAFRDSQLWIELIYNGQRMMTVLDFSAVKPAEEDEYIPSLDLLYEATPSLSDGVTVTLPYTPKDSDTVIVLTPNNNGVYTPDTTAVVDGKTITLSSPAESVKCGLQFEKSYTFSQQWVTSSKQDGSSSVITNGRLQLRRWTLNHVLSGSYTVIVVDENTDATTEYLANQVVGKKSSVLGSAPLATGSFTVPCRGKNDEIEFSIHCNSWLPVAFTSATVDANFIRKTTNV